MQAPESQSFNLDLLDRELHLAPAVTALLFRKVTESGACTRLASLRQLGKPITLDCTIEAGAWTDAAITLIGLAAQGQTLGFEVLSELKDLAKGPPNSARVHARHTN